MRTTARTVAGRVTAGRNRRTFTCTAREFGLARPADFARYSFPIGEALGRLRAGKLEMTNFEREVAVQPGVGTLALDARLRKLAAAVEVPVEGAILTADKVALHVAAPEGSGVTVTIPPDALTATTEVRLTAVSLTRETFSSFR